MIWGFAAVAAVTWAGNRVVAWWLGVPADDGWADTARRR